MNDPVPSKDLVHGTDFFAEYTIFNVARDDPNLRMEAEHYDHVTDGNHQTCRKLRGKQLASRPVMRRPASKQTRQKLVAPTKAKRSSVPQTPANKSKSRYAPVINVEKLKPRRTRTGGIFCTIAMESRAHGSNEILHLIEMLNTDNTAYKQQCLVDMKKHTQKSVIMDTIVRAM